MFNRLNQYLRSENISPWALWLPCLSVIAFVIFAQFEWFQKPGFLQDLIKSLVCFPALIILYVTYCAGVGGALPATQRCGLFNGNCYRVIKAFSSGEVGFAEGETLVFMGEGCLSHSACVQAEAPVPDEPEHDWYSFQVLGSDCTKGIRSFEAPSVKDWVSCLEHVGEPENELVVLGNEYGYTAVAGRLESPDGKPLWNAKITLSQNGRILFGGRTRADGCFDVGVSHSPSLQFVTIRVVRRGYAPFVTDVEANRTYRAPRLVLCRDAA